MVKHFISPRQVQPNLGNHCFGRPNQLPGCLFCVFSQPVPLVTYNSRKCQCVASVDLLNQVPTFQPFQTLLNVMYSGWFKRFVCDSLYARHQYGIIVGIIKSLLVDAAAPEETEIFPNLKFIRKLRLGCINNRKALNYQKNVCQSTNSDPSLLID